MKLAVLCVVYSRTGQLSYHFVSHACALRRLANDPEVSVCVACMPGVGHATGLLDQIKTTFTADEVYMLENGTSALAQTVEGLLVQYETVVVHLRGTRQLHALVELKRRQPNRIKIVYEVYSYRNTTWQRLPYSWLLSHYLRRYADYTIFLSPFALYHFARGRAVTKGGRGGVMPPAINELDPSLRRQPAPARLNDELVAILENPDTFRFIYLAQFLRGKGHRWLVEGAAPALRRHRHAQLIFAGSRGEKAQATIRALTKSLDIAHQVIFAGFIDRNDVPWVLSHCHAGIMASVSETFGYTTIEPMAAGLPFLGTRKGVAEWILFDYHTGLSYEYGERAGVERAIEYMVTHPEDARQMGENAARLVKSLFNWDNVIGSHLRIYASLIQR